MTWSYMVGHVYVEWVWHGVGMTYVRGMGMAWQPPPLRNAEAASLMWSTYLLIRLLCGTRGIEREEERLTD